VGFPTRLRIAFLLALAAAIARPQIIEFESGGLRYQTLTQNGLTVMVAQLPSNVREFSVLQVAISNGSRNTYVVKPEDFLFLRTDGSELPSIPAKSVVNELIRKASRGDVIRLVTAYENGIYGNSQYKATNGFEQRRQTALAEFVSTRLKAAAAASAIAFVQTKLLPGQSTDGAVFYANAGKPLGAGTMRVSAGGARFEFPMVSSN
jgi:hypothetical protein